MRSTVLSPLLTRYKPRPSGQTLSQGRLAQYGLPGEDFGSDCYIFISESVHAGVI